MLKERSILCEVCLLCALYAGLSGADIRKSGSFADECWKRLANEALQMLTLSGKLCYPEVFGVCSQWGTDRIFPGIKATGVNIIQIFSGQGCSSMAILFIILSHSNIYALVRVVGVERGDQLLLRWKYLLRPEKQVSGSGCRRGCCCVILGVCCLMMMLEFLCETTTCISAYLNSEVGKNEEKNEDHPSHNTTI